MVQRKAAGVEHFPGLADRLIHQHMHIRRKGLEGLGDDKVSEAIEDHIDLYPLGGLAFQRVFEFLPDLVILPDIRLQVDALARLFDCREHVLVEILSIIVDLETVIAYIDLLHVWMLK